MQSGDKPGAEENKGMLLGSGEESVSRTLTLDYMAFRKHQAFLINLLAWSLITGWSWYYEIIVAPFSLGGSDDFLERYLIIILGLGVFWYWGPMLVSFGVTRYCLYLYDSAYEWEVTNADVIIRKGLFRIRERRFPLAKIVNLWTFQKFWEKKHGWYVIEIQTKWERVGFILKPQSRGRLIGVWDPEEVRELITVRVRAARNRGNPPENESEKNN